VKLEGDNVVEFHKLPELRQVTLNALRWALLSNHRYAIMRDLPVYAAAGWLKHPRDDVFSFSKALLGHNPKTIEHWIHHNPPSRWTWHRKESNERMENLL